MLGPRTTQGIARGKGAEVGRGRYLTLKNPQYISSTVKLPLSSKSKSENKPWMMLVRSSLEVFV